MPRAFASKRIPGGRTRLVVGRLLALQAALLVGACGSTPAEPTVAPGATDGDRATPAATAPAASPGATGTFVVPATGFAFDAESVLGFYLTRGFVCAEPAPSEQAAGYEFTSCSLTDSAGRRLMVGVVTDPSGELADGFASIRGAEGEQLVDPTIALEPLAGFLGAMLGEDRASALLPWLAGHLGDTYAETVAADLHVATYTQLDGERTVLVVEVANDGYLRSPRPSPTAR